MSRAGDAIDRLREIMVALRDPETGCPWDIKQDFHSISPYTIEEAYEVADAIERDDMHDLKDELGDLLFQVIYHAQMADERGAFQLDDVVENLNQKLVRRHPHVFGDVSIETSEELEHHWESQKKDERHARERHGALEGIASTLPSLKWSQKIQKRAAKTGFDWPGVSSVFEKLDEELDELKVEVEEDEQEKMFDEYGDVMFVCVNIAQHLKIDADQALRHANRKFITRFELMEQMMSEEGVSMDELSLAEMEAYWVRAKNILKED